MFLRRKRGSAGKPFLLSCFPHESFRILRLRLPPLCSWRSVSSWSLPRSAFCGFCVSNAFLVAVAGPAESMRFTLPRPTWEAGQNLPPIPRKCLVIRSADASPHMTIPQAFDLALQRHRAGRLAEAEALYRQILAAQPKHAEAWHHLGSSLTKWAGMIWRWNGFAGRSV